MPFKNTIRRSGALEHFEVRGTGGSRLEALSDGVFALAIAILLLTSSVPKNYNELLVFVKDVVPFGVCILFIYWIWREQTTFFLRYGLLDNKVSILNLTLLFFVLFYVYPLKFLMSWLIKYFTALFSGTLAQDFQVFSQIIPFEKMPVLMIIYGMGFTCIFFTLYLMYRHSLNRKEELGLTEIEIVETRHTMKDKRNNAAVGLISVVISVISIWLDMPAGAALSGFAYNLIWVLVIIHHKKRSQELKLLLSS